MSDQSKESLLEDAVNKRVEPVGFPWLRAAFFVLVCFAVIVPFTPIPRKLRDYAKDVYAARRASLMPVEKRVEVEPKEIVIPPPAKPDPVKKIEEDRIIRPLEYSVASGGDIRQMSKGFQLKTNVSVEKGRIASEERVDDASYVAEYTLSVKLPKASKSLTELEKVNRNLGKMIPGLSPMLNQAQVSPFYFDLYENKVGRMKRDALKLADLSTKHNFYDCETILNLKHPTSGRKVLLVQADMDVVSDGSDGDRLAEMPASIVDSTHYQPFTSYGWRKQTKTPNPMVAGWKRRIGNAEKELKLAGTTAERKAWLLSRITMLKRGVADMQSRSFLVADYDPFIVMPVNMITNMRDSHAAKVGDYAVVIYKDKLYPAIVGDGGPTFKMGEGSLRLAKELDSRASPYRRPVSDLTVTYLVFSNSRDKVKKAPDYVEWHRRCNDLLKEIGGLGAGYELHQWENLFPQPEVEEEAGEVGDGVVSEPEDGVEEGE